MFLGIIFIFLWIVRSIYRYLISFIKTPRLDHKSVLITGCDTGFGHLTALRLDAAGIHVFAGCLTKEGVSSLNKKGSKNLIAFQLDVTSDESVEKAVKFVRDRLDNELWALINNAGVARMHLLPSDTMEVWDFTLGVNVFGVARMTHAFLPMIRRSKGRIINLASVAGRLGAAMNASYSASKFAVEGMSDAWRRELSIFDVKVIMIEPGFMKTPIVECVGDLEKHKDQYGEQFLLDVKEANELVLRMAGDPQQVVDALENAVTTRWPLYRYIVGKDTWLWITLITNLPTFLADMVLGKMGPKMPLNTKNRGE
eukprot:TRINITY_DN12917_c0_g1_i1.p1 TRINITY_DN12917_c0_g1~~TRINITY_DN12917_c0_g1_i1.p1  ORF type:complete len:320 (+),score=77.33 TRINITY_DN12917_c0_g1_i1:25-960(+)